MAIRYLPVAVDVLVASVIGLGACGESDDARSAAAADDAPHTVTIEDLAFEPETLAVCTLHPNMTGTVRVTR
jgi:plastocyanin